MLSDIDKEVMNKHYKANFTEPKKDFNLEKTELNNLPTKFMTPSQRKKQLDDTKQEQKKYSDWKNGHKIVIKRDRLYHNAYKSGIM